MIRKGDHTIKYPLVKTEFLKQVVEIKDREMMNIKQTF